MQNKTKALLATGLLAAQLFVTPALALAVEDATGGGTSASVPCQEGVKGVQCPLDLGKDAGPDFVVSLINTVANWMFTILLIAAVCFIVWAAYNYLTSQGDAEKVSGAHRALVYAAVAIVVAMLSRGFVYIVRNTVAGTNTPGNYYTGGVQGGNGSDGGSGSSSGDGSKAPDVTYSPMPVFKPFGVRVSVCSDSETPGVVIRDDDDEPPSFWVNADSEIEGNPRIGPNKIIKAAVPADTSVKPAKEATPAVMSANNAGYFTLVGTVTDGGFIGVGGTDYTFTVEICNDGKIPLIMYNQGTTSSDWKFL